MGTALLTLADADGAPPDLGAPVSGPKEWPDVHGRVVARGRLCRDGARVDFHGVGTYFYARASRTVVVARSAGCSWADAQDIFSRSVQPLFLQLEGVASLHASAVGTGVHAVVICGASGAGKSTSAAGLARRGFHHLADDVAYLTAGATETRLATVPFLARLDRRSRDLVDALGPRPAAPAGLPAAVPVRDIVILHRADDHPPRVEACSPDKAFLRLLPHAYCFGLDDPVDRRRFTAAFLAIAGNTRVSTIRHAGEPGSFPALIELIAKTVEVDP